MRKVKFVIDDDCYFRQEFKKENPKLTEKQINNILSNATPFRAILTLYGNNKYPDKYHLTDDDGNKININDLNGYQKGIIISDCHAYFEGRTSFNGGNKPCGVIKIVVER